ncbi:MAG: c-type cytochrome [Kiritimatiellia bacterium]|jgi:mono/diheme cytochrome c family protein
MKKLVMIMAAGVMLAANGARAEEEFKITGDPAKGEAAYKMYCVVCHGAAGAGDGVGAAALNPKPRALNDKDYMEGLTDAHIFKVIKEGGPSVGLSPMMTAWGAVLKTDEAVHDVAAYVKTLSQ